MLKASELIDAMERALEREWQQTKGMPLPAAGREDRRLILAAVARGLFDYLKSEERQLIDRITLEQSAGNVQTFEVSNLDLNVNGSA